MDEIEAKLVMPDGSLPLSKYARYYTEQDGKVHGAYTTEIEEKRPADYGCTVIQHDGRTQNVPCPALADLQPGHRRWVLFHDYPAVAAENCRAIQVQYNPVSRLIEFLECAVPMY
ncbi:hypothetical protein [Sphingomonas sp. RS2018]